MFNGRFKFRTRRSSGGFEVNFLASRSFSGLFQRKNGENRPETNNRRFKNVQLQVKNTLRIELST